MQQRAGSSPCSPCPESVVAIQPESPLDIAGTSIVSSSACSSAVSGALDGPW